MIIANPDKFRENFRARIDTMVKNPTKSTNLEIGVFNHSIKEASARKIVKKWDNVHFVQIYVDRMRTVYINMKEPETLKSIQNNSISSRTFALMTHYEMNPNKWDALIQKKIERDRNKYDVQIEAATDIFTCRKCKSTKCTYYQMQTRSADEPMTTFVSCIECGTRWKC